MQLKVRKKIEEQLIYFIDSSYYAKRLVLIVLDVVYIVSAIILAASLRLEQLWPIIWGDFFWLIFALPVVSLPIFIHIGLYDSVIRYASLDALWVVFKAVYSSFLLLWALLFFHGIEGFPRAVPFIFFFIAFLFLGGSRLFYRYLFSRLLHTKRLAKRVIIYGAGSSGIQICNALKLSEEFHPVAFVDDKKSMKGREMHGLKIYPSEKLKELVTSVSPDLILLSIPSASRKRTKEILTFLEPLPVVVKTLPHLDKLVSEGVGVEQIRDVAIEDLLGRDPVPPKWGLLTSCIKNKVVMVTGAGGSIGSEICRQVAALQPKRLVLFERSEFALYTVEQELTSSFGEEVEIIPILGSVCRKKRVSAVLKALHVNTVYHAAAYKHVPLVEWNPIEGLRNNLFGTLLTAQAAIEAGVETFVLISTDKAVRPTNVMGATKRMAEMALQALAMQKTHSTKFTMVRFGNVLGSSGSVVPLFRKQIERGGPVTVTHPDITRYFMTIPEAVQLVLQAGAMGTGGDVFVLDMGEPVRILELARKMIRLCGLNVQDDHPSDKSIAIEFTGLRPGEKLFEELLVGANVVGTEHPMIMRAEEEFIVWDRMETIVNLLDKACRNFDYSALRNILLQTVEGYSPQCDCVDPVWLATNQALRRDNCREIKRKICPLSQVDERLNATL